MEGNRIVNARLLNEALKPHLTCPECNVRGKMVLSLLAAGRTSREDAQAARPPSRRLVKLRGLPFRRLGACRRHRHSILLRRRYGWRRRVGVVLDGLSSSSDAMGTTGCSAAPAVARAAEQPV